MFNDVLRDRHANQEFGYVKLKGLNPNAVYINEETGAKYHGDVLMEAGDGSFYYITASCFFELEDYTQAVLYYEKALQLQPEEIAYYRDYIIALARSGDLEKAEDTLAYVEKEGIEAERAYKGSFNIRISPELHKQAAVCAIAQQITLNKLVENALQRYVTLLI